MNRRDFFKAALGLLGAAALPGISLTAEYEPIGFISIDAVRRAADALRANSAPLVDGGWIVIIHPDAMPDYLRATAKEEWKLAYRKARMELKKIFGKAMESGEIGHFESVRFIVSDKMAPFKTAFLPRRHHNRAVSDGPTEIG